MTPVYSCTAPANPALTHIKALQSARRYYWWRMNARSAGWEHFEHVADIGLHGYGPTAAAAFEQAALAMTAVSVEPDSLRAVKTVDIRCDAPDLDYLLVDWLNALVFEGSSRGMLFGEFEVRIDGFSLVGRARGERIEPERHRPAAEVKGATLTALGVGQDAEGCWHARCVVDV